AAVDHPGQDGAGGVHVGLDVQAPGPVPVGVRAEAGTEGRTGVRAVHADRAECALDLADQLLDPLLIGDVHAVPGGTGQAGGDRDRRVTVEVHHRHAGAFVGEALAQGAADAARAAGDDRDRTVQPHVRLPPV